MEPNFPKWVDDLFLKIALSYEGHFLDSTVNEVVDRGKKLAWQSELQRFKPETIMEASNRMVRKHPSYPPTLGEFCAICNEVFQVSRIPEHTRLEAQEKNKASEETVSRCMNEIRKKLGMKKST